MADQSNGFDHKAVTREPHAEARAVGLSGTLVWLLALLVVAFVLRVLLAVLLPNAYRPDEIFENLEPAFRMISGHGIMSWEWHVGIRSPMFPAFLAVPIALATALGLGAKVYLAMIAAVLSLISLGVVAVGFLEGRRQWGIQGALICGSLCAVWPDLVYFGPKALAEVQAGNLLVIAVYIAMRAARMPEGGESVVRSRWGVGQRMFLAGILMGLAFTLRFHLAPVLMLVGILICRKEFRRLWLPIGLGCLIPILAMGVIDYFYWGTLFATVWRSYKIEMLEHVAARFGTSPWYAYWPMFQSQWGRVGFAALLVAFVAGVRRAPLWAVVALSVVGMHSLIPHKEFSFVYAAIPPMVIVAGLGTADLVSRWKTSSAVSGFAVAIVTLLWIGLSVRIATGGFFGSFWMRHQAILKAQAALRSEPGLCGLGLRYPLDWTWTGGDVYIGRGIPFYKFRSPEEAQQIGPAMNFVMGAADVADGLPEYSVQQCWEGEGKFCVARLKVPRGCKANPKLDLNSSERLGLL